jgi:hypothetical protein
MALEILWTMRFGDRKRALDICQELFWIATVMNQECVVISLTCADFRAAHRSAEKRGEDAEVEQPGQQRYKADHRHDGAAHAVDDLPRVASSVAIS